MRKTDIKHNDFLEIIAKSMHFKLNANAHKEGLYVEIGQWSNSRKSFPTNSYWYKDEVKVIVLGNDKIQYYFKKSKLLEFISEHPERVGVYKNGMTKGISLSITESRNLAEMVII